MNTRLRAAGCCVIGLALASTGARASLMAGYLFDGTAGTSTPGTVAELGGNTARDLALGGFGAYNADTPIAYGGNTSLDVTTGIHDGAHNDTLNDFEFAGSDSFSVSVWFKAQPTTTGGQLVSQRKASTGNGWSVSVTSAGAVFFFFQGSTGPAGRIAIGGSGLDDGAWHMLTAVNDPTFDADGQMRLYVDGSSTVYTDVKVQPEPVLYDNSVFSIGKGRDLSTGNYNSFDGLIDEVGIWNHVLTTEEVDHWFANSLSTIPEPSVIALLGLGALFVRLARRLG